MGEPARQCRIVVSLKPALQVDLPVDVAATLAAAVEAEIVGLFVKEDAMVDLAGLPFARVLGFAGGQSRRLTLEDMERAFRHGERICRRALSARAGRGNLKWSFLASRGDVGTRIRHTLASGDFLVLSQEDRRIDSRGIFDVIRSSGTAARGFVIAPQRAPRPNSAAVVAIDGGGLAGEEIVQMAMRIAAVTGGQPVLFVLAPNDVEADRIVRRAKNQGGSGLLLHRVPPGDLRWLAAALARFSPAFVVSDLEGALFSDGESARFLLRAAAAPFVLLRVPGGADGETMPDAVSVPRSPPV